MNMPETQLFTRQEWAEEPQVSPKAETDDQIVSEATNEPTEGSWSGMMLQKRSRTPANGHGHMLVIAGEDRVQPSDGNESQSFE